MSRKPERVFTNKFYRIKAKNVLPKDTITVGGQWLKIHKIQRNDFGNCVIECGSHNKNDSSRNVTLIVPKNMQLHTNRSKNKSFKK